MDYLEAQRFAKSHTCAACGGELSYRYIEASRACLVFCPTNPTHQGFERQKGYMELWHQGAPIPLHVANRIEKKERRQRNMTTTAITLTDTQKQAITTHLKTFQADLALAEIQKAFTLVAKGFDPYFHLCVYQKRLMVTIDGLHWWKDRARAACRIVSEPIIDPALRAAYGVGADEIGVIAKLYRAEETEPTFTGFGRASKDEKRPVMRGSFVEHEHPYRMAEKRAEAQVIRKFHPIGVEVMIPEEAEIIPELTGEVIEGEVIEQPPTPNRCPIHDKELVKGKYDLYCPTKVQNDKGKEIWCKGVAQAEPTTEKPPEESPEQGLTLARFYEIAVKELNYKTREKVHSSLKVASMDEWKEPLELALDTLAQLQGKKWR